ncbi:MAG: hypothetical protein K2R98_17530 [Gemmataceae bacterium]|nr:hypothetical protein [Gemmataceae bacterium]
MSETTTQTTTKKTGGLNISPILFYGTEAEAQAAGAKSAKSKLFKVTGGDKTFWAWSASQNAVMAKFANDHLGVTCKNVNGRNVKPLTQDDVQKFLAEMTVDARTAFLAQHLPGTVTVGIPERRPRRVHASRVGRQRGQPRAFTTSRDARHAPETIPGYFGDDDDGPRAA